MADHDELLARLERLERVVMELHRRLPPEGAASAPAPPSASAPDATSSLEAAFSAAATPPASATASSAAGSSAAGSSAAGSSAAAGPSSAASPATGSSAPPRSPDPLAGGPSAAPAPAAPARTAPLRPASSAEVWDGRLWLNRLGIGLLLLGVALLFRYSIEQGWVTPAVRVAFGAAVGTVLLVAGLRLGGRRAWSAVLTGGGIATYYIVGFAAFHLYGLLGYTAAFVAMVGITALSFGLALRRGELAVALLGAAGGLGTPLLLGLQHGTPRGFALYTVAMLAWTSVVYLRRGWRLLLWESAVGGWLLLSLYAWHASEAVRATPLDRWTLQGAALFALLATGVLPALQRVRRGDARAERRWGELEALHWYAIVSLPPWMALIVAAQVWDPSEERWGTWALAAAAAYGAAAFLLRARDGRLARVTALAAAVLLVQASGTLLDGEWLMVAFAAQGLALHSLAARAGGGRVVRVLAHLLQAGVGLWVMVEILSMEGTIPAPTAAAWLFALGASFASSYLMSMRTLSHLYRWVAHAGLLAWTWRVLSTLPGGEGVVTIAWGVYAVGLLVFGMRTGRTRVERTGLVTILLVVAKLFLVDLAALEALYRVLLFLGFGAVFLFLSYSLQGWLRADGDEDAPPAADASSPDDGAGRT